MANSKTKVKTVKPKEKTFILHEYSEDRTSDVAVPAVILKLNTPFISGGNRTAIVCVSSIHMPIKDGDTYSEYFIVMSDASDDEHPVDMHYLLTKPKLFGENRPENQDLFDFMVSLGYKQILGINELRKQIEDVCNGDDNLDTVRAKLKKFIGAL